MAPKREISNEKLEVCAYGIEPETAVEIYLSVDDSSEEEKLVAPLTTAIAIYVMKFAKINRKMELYLTKTLVSEDCITLRTDLGLPYRLVGEAGLPDQVTSCSYPMVFVKEKRLCVTGLCSVLRFLLRKTIFDLKTVGESCKLMEQLLGYQGENILTHKVCKF